MGGLRKLSAPFVVPGPSGVAVRTRLRQLGAADVEVPRRVGAICAHAYIQSLEAGARTLRHRLSPPVGQKGAKHAPGGYRSRREWHAGARRPHVLEDRPARERADWAAGTVHVVRGGEPLARARHHLPAAGLSEAGWRERWEAARWCVQADGESGKRFGNETIRITPDGEVSIRLPAPLQELADAPHGRYVLTGRVTFAHRGREWADRAAANRAVAYRIHHDPARGRWYVTASWQKPVTRTIPLNAELALPATVRPPAAARKCLRSRPGRPMPCPICSTSARH
ncbi:hypothetical protein J2S50_002162 [Streptomyces sp. DSM 40167]|nr:hypothetical protein [Streptomyces sp. DSM 40167]